MAIKNKGGFIPLTPFTNAQAAAEGGNVSTGARISLCLTGGLFYLPGIISLYGLLVISENINDCGVYSFWGI